jgi:ATP-dependent Lon protease
MKYPVLALRDVVVFPSMAVPLFVGREKSIAAIESAATAGTQILLVTQKDGTVVTPGYSDLHEVGTLAEIIQVMRLPDGTVKALVQGIRRVKVDSADFSLKTPQAGITELDEVPAIPGLQAHVDALKSSFAQLALVDTRYPEELRYALDTIKSESELVDTLGAHLRLQTAQKQELLAEMDVTNRLNLVHSHVQGQIEAYNLEKRIQSRVKKQAEKSQKEYYLNEQLNAIKKELGDGDEKSDVDEIEEKLATTKMPDEIKAKAKKELKKLKQMAPISAEAGVTRNYLDWMTSLPWGIYTEDDNSIKKAREVLNADHYGLEEVKDRLIEYLAVRSLAKDKQNGVLICLAGPPGVGKTSIATSLAASLGRKFARISLGGVRDEAEIRGHRRTYVGALPGKIIQALKKVGTCNPVILLDEIDKMSNDSHRGDPAAAMLEVLDPAQNKTFSDHYLEVDFDLSKVMFIMTANDLSNVPRPLLDRMEVIHVPGYTPQEKMQIAKRHLLPKAITSHGLDSHRLSISDEKLTEVVNGYTREAGVRSLERQMNTIARKIATDVVENDKQDGTEFEISDLEKYLGPAKFEHNKKEELPQIGLVNGLAWTSVGGDMLNIETITSPGTGKLQVTGKLGEVMQESAKTAYSYVRSIASDYGVEDEWFTKNDVHIHVPDGATPKDGPSAGITMATALMSAIGKIAVRQNVAMTGEISLRGKVMPIGGLKEKILAAKQAGITTVICPEKNRKDVTKVSEEIKDGMDIRFVSEATEVLTIALQR